MSYTGSRSTLVFNKLLCNTVLISETVEIMLNMPRTNIEKGLRKTHHRVWLIAEGRRTFIKILIPQYTDTGKNIHLQKGKCTITT